MQQKLNELVEIYKEYVKAKEDYYSMKEANDKIISDEQNKLISFEELYDKYNLHGMILEKEPSSFSVVTELVNANEIENLYASYNYSVKIKYFNKTSNVCGKSFISEDYKDVKTFLSNQIGRISEFSEIFNFAKRIKIYFKEVRDGYVSLLLDKASELMEENYSLLNEVANDKVLLQDTTKKIEELKKQKFKCRFGKKTKAELNELEDLKTILLSNIETKNNKIELNEKSIVSKNEIVKGVEDELKNILSFVEFAKSYNENIKLQNDFKQLEKELNNQTSAERKRYKNILNTFRYVIADYIEDEKFIRFLKKKDVKSCSQEEIETIEKCLQKYDIKRKQEEDDYKRIMAESLR